MMQEKTFQIIFDELNKCLSEDWEKLVLYLEYGEAEYSYAFYVLIDGKYVNGYDLHEVSKEEIAESFRKIDKAVLEDRKESKDKLWTNMTMIVSPDGSMHTDFDYTDLTEGSYNYKKRWKEKYLG